MSDTTARCAHCCYWDERGHLGMVAWVEDGHRDPRRWGYCGAIGTPDLDGAPLGAETPGAVAVTKDGYTSQYLATSATFGCALFAKRGE